MDQVGLAQSSDSSLSDSWAILKIWPLVQNGVECKQVYFWQSSTQGPSSPGLPSASFFKGVIICNLWCINSKCRLLWCLICPEMLFINRKEICALPVCPGFPDIQQPCWNLSFAVVAECLQVSEVQLLCCTPRSMYYTARLIRADIVNPTCKHWLPMLAIDCGGHPDSLQSCSAQKSSSPFYPTDLTVSSLQC